MASKHDNRVLNRKGAHELTQEEMEKIAGNGNRMNTVATPTGTGAMHHDSDFDQ